MLPAFQNIYIVRFIISLSIESKHVCMFATKFLIAGVQQPAYTSLKVDHTNSLEIPVLLLICNELY